MERSPIAAPILVDEAGQLEPMMQELRGTAVIALDCEMDSFWSYSGKLCLLQISNGEKEWIVDPLAVDIREFGKVLEDEKIVKIFHDAEFDVRQLKRDYNFVIKNIFDTRAAEATLGCSTPGLASVVQTRFDVTLSKKMQRADWTLRPLTDEALRYAQLDVAYLVPLRLQLIEELRSQSREAVLETEHRRLEHLEALGEPYSETQYARIKGASKLNGTARRRLMNVHAARDAIAKNRDRAPFRVVSNQFLLELATDPPDSPATLLSRRGIGKRDKECAQRLFEALKKAVNEPPIERNPPKRDGLRVRRSDQARYDAVRTLRAEYAKTHQLDGSLVLRRETMTQLAANPPADLEALAPYLDAWQLEAFGQALIDALSA